MAWLVAGLEKVRTVDRGPWLPAVGSETPTVYVMKLGSPNDFSFTKASTAGDPDLTWEEGNGERACSVEARSQVGLQVSSSSLTTHAGLLSQDQVGPQAQKLDPQSGSAKEATINITEF